MPRFGSVYVVVHRDSGACYVGQTTRTVDSRWAAHWRTAKCDKARKHKFQEALREYGPTAFDVQEVYVAFDGPGLNAAEIALIADLDPEYNSTKGGRGLRPVAVTEEKRRSTSERFKLLWQDSEWRARRIAQMQELGKTAAFKERGAALAQHKGAQKRWAGHVKKAHVPKEKADSLRRSWTDPQVRERRIAGLKKALSKPEVRQKYVAASTGRKMPASAVQKSAAAKWRPVYCPEMQCSFLSQKAAADFLGVRHNTVSAAVARKGSVAGRFTLVRVS